MRFFFKHRCLLYSWPSINTAKVWNALWSSFRYIVFWANCFLMWSFLAFGRQNSITRGFYKLQDKSLVGNVTAVNEVKDFFDCSFLCLLYGPSACLSFHLNRTLNENGLHFCEISNSERLLEPEKIKKTLHYDYYGTTFEVSSLKRIF